jgi:hypothetical protein
MRRDYESTTHASQRAPLTRQQQVTIARHALRNLGGEVTLEDRPNGGAIATLLHPVEKRPLKKSEF